jgi:peptidoglycan/xylan/chitin deacetylase (PgdA/CDA1 family)
MKENPHKHGYFVISLDFELFWGMFDKVTLETYGKNVAGERTAIPQMLELFKTHGIHATWATVGMLMTRNKRELLSLLPPSHLRPIYEDMKVSAYTYIETANIGDDEKTDIYHFGPSLIALILETPHQEIANHTFSHYYCIDGNDNDISLFARDLEAHNAIAHTYNIVTESIVFPRNQTNDDALRVCKEKGIYAYRGNEDHVLYRPRKDSEQSLLIRAFRLLDHYINISGHHTYQLSKNTTEFPLNIPASRFLRPWSHTLRFFEWLRLRRIKNSMTYAAKHGEVFHLWWHPHNFGINQKENFKNLEAILEHYEILKKKYTFESASMKDIANIKI